MIMLGNQAKGLCVACSQPLPVEAAVVMTCSRPCHERLVAHLERAFGNAKRVSTPDGKTYLVPLRYIIEHGLRADDLSQFLEIPAP